MKRIIYLTLIFALLISCQDKKKPDSDASQMETVLAIHDEVMPKMGKLGKLVSELKPKIDSTEQGQLYEDSMKDLQKAHKSMMDWMQGFGERFDHDEIMNGAALSQQKQEWLDEEEEKVKMLKKEINSSIERAESLLRGNKNN